MIKCEEFFGVLKDNGINFFCGVPDSLLKDFCAYLENNYSDDQHFIAANEGNAVAIAAGHYLATREIGLVYMQNSGLGNSVNPITSLIDPDVYNIPALLLIGWRGEPGKKDEPQHVKQGKITLNILETLGVPYEILPDSINEVKNRINHICSIMKEQETPYALVVREGAFQSYESTKVNRTRYEMTREEAIKLIIDHLSVNDIIVSTTGKTSRELYEYRESLKQGHSQDFLTVGSMGHASQIALGIALAKPNRQVFCIDGDGAAIMHLGALAIIGANAPSNFKHIIINNGCHDSVGGQPTVGYQINFGDIAKACGYKTTQRYDTKEEIEQRFSVVRDNAGPVLIEIRVNQGSRKDLGRPLSTPIENRNSFMRFLRQ